MTAMSSPTESKKSQLNLRINQDKHLLQQVIRLLQVELRKFPKMSAASALLCPEKAAFHLEVDPFDSSETLTATWKNVSGGKLGEVRIHETGNIYAETDVLLHHPENAKWFVESVLVWGRKERLKTDLRLIEAI